MAQGDPIDDHGWLLNSNRAQGPRTIQTMSRVENSSHPSVSKPANEPEPISEADVPSDGPDEIGEAMIRDLPRTLGRPVQPAPVASETRS